MHKIYGEIPEEIFCGDFQWNSNGIFKEMFEVVLGGLLDGKSSGIFWWFCKDIVRKSLEKFQEKNGENFEEISDNIHTGFPFS